MTDEDRCVTQLAGRQTEYPGVEPGVAGLLQRLAAAKQGSREAGKQSVCRATAG